MNQAKRGMNMAERNEKNGKQGKNLQRETEIIKKEKITNERN